MKNTVVYHKSDADGWFCREIARKFIPDAEFIGWDFGDVQLFSPDEGTIYVLDLPIDRVFGIAVHALHAHAWRAQDRVVWIDHHASAIASHPTDIHGYRIDGVAACRLAWQWFNRMGDVEGVLSFPQKKHFVDRIVTEPWGVRLAGEHDIWDHRDPDTELFQHGLRSQELTEYVWNGLLSSDEGTQTAWTGKLILAGISLQYARTQENEGIIKSFGFTIHFEGFCLLACNTARYNSQLFSAGLLPEHDGCLGFNWDGTKQEWRVSLYSDKPGIDLSVVAVKYGGGGHRGAAGFRTKTLTFL